VSPLVRVYVRFIPFCRDLRDLPSFPTRRSSDLDGHFRARLHLCTEGCILAGHRPGGGDHDVGVGGRCTHRNRRSRRQQRRLETQDRKSTRLNSSHVKISYAVFCLKKKKYSSREL